MFEFIVLLILLFFVLYIMVDSLKIGISPMPTNKKTSYKILEILKNEKQEKIYELGSGFGSLAIFLATNLPNKKVIAYEVSIIPWLVSIILKRLLKTDNLHIYRKDFLFENLNDGVLVCYLFPKGMEKLEDKIFDDTINTTIISNTFAFRNIKQRETLVVNDFLKTLIFIYRT